MEPLGAVDRIAQGRLVVELDENQLPEVGDAVVDSSLSAVGRVVDVIGPVDGPLAVVVPDDAVHPPEVLGERLYVDE